MMNFMQALIFCVSQFLDLFRNSPIWRSANRTKTTNTPRLVRRIVWPRSAISRPPHTDQWARFEVPRFLEQLYLFTHPPKMRCIALEAEADICQSQTGICMCWSRSRRPRGRRNRSGNQFPP